MKDILAIVLYRDWNRIQSFFDWIRILIQS